jgi:hypothetical protein
VAPVEGSEEMIDLELEVKDGLLAIECSYPTEKDLEELSRVWLTNNKQHWDPRILEEDESITIPSCWDGESEFMLATTVDAQEQDAINQFGNYYLQNQRATLFMLKAFGLMSVGTALYNTFNDVKEKSYICHLSCQETGL